MEAEKAESEMAGEKDKVLAAGGMHILGSERHESRRIDNQACAAALVVRAIRVHRNSF